MNLSYHCVMRQSKANQLLRELSTRLEDKYGHEGQSLALLLLEDVLDLSRNQILLNEGVKPAKAQLQKLNNYVEQLLQDIPIQHILGWADFYDHRFEVNKEVLIPRQETEELVQLVAEISLQKAYSSLLDIGTGSGCIAISLALENPHLEITAIDISIGALEVAKKNAQALSARIDFLLKDILHDSVDGKYDVIVSNPPYVLETEKEVIPANVLNHDPELALFVPDEKPLMFYQRIIDIAQKCLNKQGLLFFEINEKFGAEVANILLTKEFADVSITNDLNDKPRFVFGFKN